MPVHFSALPLPSDLKKHMTLVLVSQCVPADRVINGRCLADFDDIFFNEEYDPLRSHLSEYFVRCGSSAKVVLVKSKREQPKVIIC